MVPPRPAATVPKWSPGLASILIALAFAARLPALAEPVGIDQGIFGTAAWGMQEGLRLYTDLWDQKPPGVHLTYRAGFALLGISPSSIFWMDFLAALACAALLFVWGRAAVGPRLGVTAAAVFAAGSLPALRFSYGGFLERAVPETFITVLLTAAAFAVTRASLGLPHRWLPVAAFAIGAAGVMKPTAFVYAIALGIWIAWFGRQRMRVSDLASSTAALVAPGLLVVLWLYAQGNLRDAWIAVVEYNRAYVLAGGGVGRLILELAKTTWRYVKTDPVWTAGFCAMVAAIVACVRTRRILPLPALCFCWLAASAVAIGANGIRMYTTYFIPPVPALSMAVAWLVVDWPGRGRRWLSIVAIALGLGVAVSRGGADRFVETTRADWHQLNSKEGGSRLYLERFGGYATGRGYSARANAELAEFVKTHTEPADRIYIFGMAPAVYLLSRRLPANRFLWAYPAVSDTVRGDAFTLDALVQSLEAAQPRLLILERNNRDSLMGWRIEQHFQDPAMIRLLGRYRLQGQIEDFLIYARESGV
jgi:hypothetical protein